MKILVTGGAGYIGSVLVDRLLKERYTVIAVDNLMYNQSSLLGYINHPFFSFHRFDVREIPDELYESVDAIIPLAAIVGAPACKKDPILSATINDLCIRRLEKFKKAKIIYPNTNSGYGTKSGSKYCTEESKLEPISEYGIQKVNAERYLLEHHQNTVSFRLATVFGVSPRMRWDLLVNGLVHDALRHGYLVLFEPHAARNYIHIKDICDCFVHALNSWDSMNGQVYNLGLDRANLTKMELAELVARYTKCEIFTSPKQIDPDKRNYIVSNKKLKKAGFSAMYSIEDGIEDLMAAYQITRQREQWRNV